MAKIEGFRIRNFRTLRDVTLGRLWNNKGIEEPLMFEIYYRQEHNARPITYEVSFTLDAKNRPYVKSERLRQRRKGQDRGRPFSFLILKEGRGLVWKGEHEGIDEQSAQPSLFDLAN